VTTGCGNVAVRPHFLPTCGFWPLRGYADPMAEPVAEALHAALSLSAGPEIVPVARRFVIDHLETWRVQAEVRDDAALIASELVTNALRYGPPPIVLDISVEGARVRLSVADSSSEEPRRVPPTLLGEGGRGLALLAALSAAWGSEVGSFGKSVWCELGSSD